MNTVIKKKHLVSLLFGASLLSGFISSHKVLTLLSGGRYFWRVVTIGTLRYLVNLLNITKQGRGTNKFIIHYFLLC